jgi:hypothetical protein
MQKRVSFKVHKSDAREGAVLVTAHQLDPHELLEADPGATPDEAKAGKKRPIDGRFGELTGNVADQTSGGAKLQIKITTPDALDQFPPGKIITLTFDI